MGKPDRDRSLVDAGFFVLRTPLLPFGIFATWADGVALGDRATLRSRLRELVAAPEVLEALFVASPSLEESLAEWERDPDGERGRKVERSLVRYVSRMAARPTPFGLFAGCSVGRVGDATRLRVAARADYRRHTRLDMEYVCTFVQELLRLPELRDALGYRVNSSLYELAGQIRYAEARLFDRVRSYHLVALDVTEPLCKTLARADGARPEVLATALVADDPEIVLDEARAFIAELIDAQVLVPDIWPAVTGPEPLATLIARLDAVPATRVAAASLQGAADELAALDAARLGNSPARYRDLAAALAPLPAKVDLPRLFQVDMVKPAPEATLGPKVLDAVREAVALLHRISGGQGNPLARFKEAFTRRYEQREVPLCEVLDEENGIGFNPVNGPGSDASPLIAGLPFGGVGGDTGRGWGAREHALYPKLEAALRSGTREIVLDDKDLERLTSPSSPPLPLPDSLAVMATLAADSPAALADGRFRLLIEGVSGPSGALLLGRFCHADPALEAEVRRHLADEEAHHPDAIFAEIVHLPEGRIGNILSRPVLRAYEIPFLGESGAAREQQLPVTDLLVSVVAGRVVLRSARLGREVIPRMTNAHNFSYRTVGVYQFLCSLARQGVAGGLGWSWGAIEASFFPRVVTGRFVLSRATWHVAQSDLEPLGKGDADVQLAAVQRLRVKLGLPRRIYVADADNLLPVDLDNALLVDSFVQLVKSRPRVELKEVFPGLDELCADGPEGAFAHELVVPLSRPRDATALVAAPSPTTRPRRAIARQLPFGSEWLYAKLYCGTATADRVLRELVAPLCAGLDGAVDRWFFIRYADPDPHLRFRLHGNPERLVHDVAPMLAAAAEPLLADGRLWRVQLDTYEREIERYGGPEGMLACEEVFHHDSRAAAEIVGLLSGDEGATARWQLALYGMDRLLDDLGLDLTQRRALLATLRKSFVAEHGGGTALDRGLGDKFRAERRAIEKLFDSDGDDHPFASGLVILRERSRAIAQAAATLRRAASDGILSAPLDDVAGSLLHMHANRMLRSNARAYEAVLYDFLVRLYDSRLARAADRRDTIRAHISPR